MRKTLFPNLFAQFLVAAVVATSFIAIFGPSRVSAVTVSELCAKKINASKCEKSVKETCESKKGKDKEKCQKARADKYKDKKASASNQDVDIFGAGDSTVADRCGNPASGNSVETKFDFGCLGTAAPPGTNAIQDLAFAIVRFLSYGVGIVIVISIIWAGIEYSTSEGSAEQTQSAKNRIRDAIVGLVIYIFAFSIIQYLVPGGLFAS